MGRIKTGDSDYENHDRKQNRAANFGLTLGLLSILLNVLTGIPAIVFGIIALGRARETGEGRGRAIGGIAAGIVGSLVSGFVGYTLYSQSVSKQTAGAAKTPGAGGFQYSADNLDRMKRLRIIQDFGESNLTAYTAKPGVMSKDGQSVPMDQRMMSWRVTMLLHLGDADGYRGISQAYDKKVPWNAPANREVTSKVIPIFADESNFTNETRFRVFTGPDTVFPHGKPGLFMARIPDGSSNTAILVESSELGPWAEPRDVEYSKSAPLPSLGSPERDSFLMMTADGAIRAYKKTVDEKILRRIIGASDGENIGSPNNGLPEGMSGYVFNPHAK